MNTDRNWITPSGQYALRLTTESWQQIERECDRSSAIETGGVLLGHYTNDRSTAVATEALPPPKDSRRSRSSFHRGVAGLYALLAKRWKGALRTYYIGEWHYHPASIVEPSGEDLAQMHAINRDPRYRCREPIMLIIGQATDSYERSARAFLFPQGEEYVEFVSVSNGA